MASPPSASITARSAAIRPGSCPVPRGRSGPSAVEYAAGQPGGLSKIRQQPCPGVSHHPRTIGSDLDLGTQPDTLHVESALRLDRQNPSARFIFPGQKGTFAFSPRQPPHLSETARPKAPPSSCAARAAACVNRAVVELDHDDDGHGVATGMVGAGSRAPEAAVRVWAERRGESLASVRWSDLAHTLSQESVRRCLVLEPLEPRETSWLRTRMWL
jgi:hypothetical protein